MTNGLSLIVTPPSNTYLHNDTKDTWDSGNVTMRKSRSIANIYLIPSFDIIYICDNLIWRWQSVLTPPWPKKVVGFRNICSFAFISPQMTSKNYMQKYDQMSVSSNSHFVHLSKEQHTCMFIGLAYISLFHQTLIKWHSSKKVKDGNCFLGFFMAFTESL